MEPFKIISGVAAALAQANVDTDVIMPKQFLKGITRDDLARGVFYDLRFDESDRERPEFVLNRGPYREPRFLIVGPNFGCGSSREHAVWGLVQFGIRAILGTTFASIFRDNCFRNGLLPISLPPEEILKIQTLCANPERSQLRIDLLAQTISLADGTAAPFEIAALRRDDLLNGRDPIESTLQFSAAIADFERTHWSKSPWLRPSAVSA